MKVRRLLALFMVVCMVLLLSVACTPDAPGGDTADTADTTGNDATNDADVTTDDPSDPDDTAGGGGAADDATGVATTGPFGRFPETVSMSIGRFMVTDPAFDEGQDMENNIFIDLIYESLNIAITYDWLVAGDGYETRISLVMASGDMPDTMYVNNRQQLNQLFESGMLLCLSDAFDQYASDMTRAFYESYMQPHETVILEAFRYNGELLALPNTNIAYQYTLTWVRRDWMEAVGETAPQSMEDIIRIARTFVAQDPGNNGPGNTIGFVSSPYLAGHYNDVAVLDNLFSYFQSFPRAWIYDDAAGGYVYGTTQPQTREALALLAELFEEGLIDPQFATNDRVQAIAAGQVGIVMGPWWQPWWPLAATVEQGNPDAVWDPFIAPLAPDGYFYQSLPNPHTNWMVANRDFAYPEAVIKMFNLTNVMLGQYYAADDLIPNTTTTHGEIYDSLNRSWTMWPFPIQMIWNDGVLGIGRDMRMQIDAGSYYATNPSHNSYIQGYRGFNANPGYDIDHTIMYMNTRSVILQYENDHLLRYPRIGFPGVTDTMEQRWAHLQTMENQMLLEIVMGIEPIEHFDIFVQQWLDQGGAQITEEVNEILLGR